MLTPQERTFLEQLKKEWVSKEDASKALEKSRQWSPVWEFFTGIGKWLYGVASQVSRLAPWDQSADPTSFYSRSQRDMKGAEIERMRAGQNVDSFSSKAGQFVGETLPTIPVSMWTGALAKWLLGLWLKVAPKVAWYATRFSQLLENELHYDK